MTEREFKLRCAALRAAAEKAGSVDELHAQVDRMELPDHEYLRGVFHNYADDIWPFVNASKPEEGV